MSSITFEDAHAFLQKPGKDGVSLQEHLSEVLLRIVSEKPEDAVELFESISSEVKRTTFKAPKMSDGELHDAEEAQSSRARARKEWAASVHRFFKKPKVLNEDGEEEEEEEEEGEGEPVQDLPNELEALEWAGIGLGREDGFRLYLSMKQLSRKVGGLTGLRFWGKILGRDQDYFVVEGQLPDEEDPEPEEGKEAIEGKDGANKHVYFVCNAVGAEWTRLPNVVGSHVVVARRLRRFFTGNLSARVPGHPPFRGEERHLLRATIARIAASTTLAPTGLFEAEEDNEYAFGPAEEPAVPEQEELRDAGNWVHLLTELNVAGHAKPVVKDEDDEGAGDEGEEEPAPVPPLRAVGEDADGEPEKCWDIAPCPRAGGDDPNAIVRLRSLVWPGAVTVAFGKRFVNAYVGYGLKYSDAAYSPQPPASIQAEFQEEKMREQADVTTDPDEGKKGEEEEEEEDE